MLPIVVPELKDAAFLSVTAPESVKNPIIFHIVASRKLTRKRFRGHRTDDSRLHLPGFQRSCFDGPQSYFLALPAGLMRAGSSRIPRTAVPQLTRSRCASPTRLRIF